MEKYLVAGMDIKLVQDTLLEIMIEIDRICRKNDIRYILDGGTQLGAFRHNGFIPWDDDLDIAMLREEYDRFVEACKRDLDHKYFVCSTDTEKAYTLNFLKIMKRDTRYVQDMYKDLDVPQCIYVDVFPIDNIMLKTKKIQCAFISLYNGIRLVKFGIYPKDKTLKYSILKCASFLSLDRINKRLNSVMRYYDKKETKYVYKVCHPGKKKPHYKRDMYLNVEEKDFEGHMFLVPKDHDEFLKRRFGNSYMKMPPESIRHPAHDILEVKL